MIYILGIMAYKFGLEAFNGSVVALATNRYDYESIHNNMPSRTFERVGLLTGLNQAFQCVGSILIAPLVRHIHIDSPHHVTDWVVLNRSRDTKPKTFLRWP